MFKYFFLIAVPFIISNAQAQIKFVQPNMKNPEESVVYIGIQNYFVIQNRDGLKIISVSCKEGKVEKLSDSSFHFLIKDEAESGIQFFYTCMKNGKLQKSIAYPVLYQTVRVPDIARLRLGTKTSGKISLVELKTVTRLALDDRNFKSRLKYTIQCEVHCKPLKSNEKYMFVIKNGDLLSNADYQDLLAKLSKGDKIKFENIKVIGNNRSVRTLESVTFLID